MEQIITLKELKKKFPYTFVDNMGKEMKVINMFYSHTKQELTIYLKKNPDEKTEATDQNHF